MDGSIYSANEVELHFLATHCQDKVLAGLPWCRDHTELLQGAQSIPGGQTLRHFAIGEAEEASE